MIAITNLTRLAVLYATHRDIPLSVLGTQACNNNRVFVRLLGGHHCRTDTAERASQWLVDNWPRRLPWPTDIPRPPRTKKRAAAAETNPSANADDEPRADG